MVTEFQGIEISELCAAVKNAGEAILEVYARDFDVELKGDDSPLTEADQNANAVLMEYFQSSYPEIPVISEENKEIAYAERKDWAQREPSMSEQWVRAVGVSTPMVLRKSLPPVRTTRAWIR